MPNMCIKHTWAQLILSAWIPVEGNDNMTASVDREIGITNPFAYGN